MTIQKLVKTKTYIWYQNVLALGRLERPAGIGLPG
jgi:hypothetical protein